MRPLRTIRTLALVGVTSGLIWTPRVEDTRLWLRGVLGSEPPVGPADQSSAGGTTGAHAAA